MSPEPLHKPVLIHEVLDLTPNPCPVIFDFTLGRAGHALALLEARPEARLYGSDRDPQAIEAGKQILAPHQDRVELFLGTFSEAAEHWNEQGLQANLILADLGVSSPQIDQSERGFSFMQSGPLDMRMDPTRGPTALDLMIQTPQKELAQIFFRLGEESFGNKIAQRIKEKIEGLNETKDLANLVSQVIPRKFWPNKIHPATKVFQALRMAVNQELEEIEALLDAVPNLLVKDGVAMLISFHSLEDRLVKQAFRLWADPCTCSKDFPYCQCGAVPLVQLLRKKPIVATQEETRSNPRARSAKLGIATRL